MVSTNVEETFWRRPGSPCRGRCRRDRTAGSERVVELGLQFGMEGAFPENSLRRLLHKLVLPVGEHVVRRGDRREQQQDAVVEGVAGDRLDGLGEHGQHGG